MANKEHLSIFQQGVDKWNQWRKKHDKIEPDLQGVDLANTDLSRADLSRTNLTQANLQYTNLSHVNLYRANLTGANLKGVKGAQCALNLEMVLLGRQDVVDFDTCERDLYDKWLDWERFRVVGRLPLFSASYTALILIPIIFYIFSLYNSGVQSARDVVEQVEPQLELLIQSARDMAGQVEPQLGSRIQQGIGDIENTLYKIIDVVKSHLTFLKVPSQSFYILISTVLLATGSTLYTFLCPSRIKEFGRDQWCDEIGRPLVHYWPFAWKYPRARLCCAICYTLGGAIALGVIVTKVLRAAYFIITNSDLWYSPF